MLPGSGDLIAQFLRRGRARNSYWTGAKNLVRANGANTGKLGAGRTIEAEPAIALSIGSRRLAAARTCVERQRRRLPGVRVICSRVCFGDLVGKTESADRIPIAHTVVEQAANILTVIEVEGDADAFPLFQIAVAVGDPIQSEALSRGAQCVFLIAYLERLLLRFGRRGFSCCARKVRDIQHTKHSKGG